MAASSILNGFLFFFFTLKRLWGQYVLQIIFFPSKTSTTVLARDLLSIPAHPPVICLSHGSEICLL